MSNGGTAIGVVPILASCAMSLCSISSRAFSLFSSFCIMLATSTMAPLYTIRLPDSLVSDGTRAFEEGSRLLFPEIEENTWVKSRRCRQIKQDFGSESSPAVTFLSRSPVRFSIWASFEEGAGSSFPLSVSLR